MQGTHKYHHVRIMITKQRILACSHSARSYYLKKIKFESANANANFVFTRIAAI